MSSHAHALQRAQKALKEATARAGRGVLRQKWHFMPPAGWLNDPNGLIFFQDQYHLFYQHNPYASLWGSMHWGHAVSKDMVHWEHLPPALAPSEAYESGDGCFSGTALEKDGTLYLFYTASDTSGPVRVQSQCLATSGDGVHFKKYPGNPLLPAPPPGFDGANFRDPKVWAHEEKYYLLCSSKSNGRAAALLYRSDDLLGWEFFSVMAQAQEGQETMWECPDLFSAGDRDVFLFSPMHGQAGQQLYWTGRLDYQTGRFLRERQGVADYGPDCYAGQTLHTPDHRRILFAWAGTWPWMPWHSGCTLMGQEGWCGFLTAPRQLALDAAGQLTFHPLPELALLRKSPVKIEPALLAGRFQIPGCRGSAMEMVLEVDAAATTVGQAALYLHLAPERFVVVEMDFRGSRLAVDRIQAYPGSLGRSESPWPREPQEGGLLRLHLLIDQSSVEVFTGGYTVTHSANLFSEAPRFTLELVIPQGELALANGWVWELDQQNKWLCGKQRPQGGKK